MNCGMCHLASIPVRRVPDLCSEMVNQLLFGETFSILKEHDHYRLICSHHDGYEGWIDGRQTLIGLDAREGEDAHVIALETAMVDGVSILKGSTLPAFENGKFRCGEQTHHYPGETSKNLVPEPEALVEYAKSYLGTPYHWGGRSPFGIDCSGFVQVVYRAFGEKLPRDASDQIAAGEAICLTDARPGDLVFLKSAYDGSPHVGLALGEGKIIHASAQVRIDTLDEQGAYNEDSKAHSHHLSEVRRVFA